MAGVPLARAVATALHNVVSHDGPAQDMAREVGACQVAMALLRFGAALGLARGLVPAGAGLVRSLTDGNPLNQQAFGGLGTLSLLLQLLEVSQPFLSFTTERIPMCSKNLTLCQPESLDVLCTQWALGLVGRIQSERSPMIPCSHNFCSCK